MDKHKKLANRLREYGASRKGEIADLTNRAADAIEELLKVQDQMGDDISLMNEELLKHEWIPVSERLPETSDTYIVTADMYGVTLGEEWYQGSIVRQLFYNAHRKKWSSEEENTWVDDVIAWQPRPEPYKGEE